MVDIDGALHVTALVQCEIVNLIVSAGGTMSEWGDPSALRL